MRNVRPLTRLAAALTLLFLVLVAVEHAVVPSYDPVDHMISEYANAGGFAGVVGTVALLTWGVSFLTTAGVAAEALARRALAQAIVGCLIVAGVGLTIAAVWPTQAVRGVVPAGVDLELSGRLHDLGSGAAQLAVFAAVLLGGRVIAASRFRIATLVVLLIAVVLAVGLTVLDPDARGLRQRTLVAAACTWQFAFLSGLRNVASRAGARNRAGRVGLAPTERSSGSA